MGRSLSLQHEPAGKEGARRLAFGLREKIGCQGMLDNPAMMQENDILRESARLADIVGDDDDLNAAMLGLDEQGLGDAVDCLGQPSTQGGAILKVMQCQLVRSGLFHLVLSPDYDDAHHDHFHLEALPWTDRATVRGDRPAIH